MKAKDLIGKSIPTINTEDLIITDILPVDNKDHYRTDYNYVLLLNNRTEKITIEELYLSHLPKEIEFED